MFHAVRSTIVALTLLVSPLLVPGIASAEPAPAASPQSPAPSAQTAAAPKAVRRVITLEPVDIPGRLQRPLASVDVARVTTRVAFPQRPFSAVGRIEAASGRAPF